MLLWIIYGFEVEKSVTGRNEMGKVDFWFFGN